jgi:phenylalanyl-tRNA synthetase beta chain
MKISLEWLAEYVDLSGLDPAELADRLTMSTAEVEGVEVLGGDMEGVVTAKVLRVMPHPDAEKLVLADVFDGEGEKRVVCGAPNLAVGQTVPLARAGGRLPDGTRIKKGKIRGELSAGMICSERELGLGPGADGILVLDGEVEPGLEISRALGLTDHVLEIDNKSLTHRPDLWCHYGIAREVAAITGRDLAPMPGSGPGLSRPDAENTALEVRTIDPDLCPRYCAAVVEGLAIGPSPAWMARRLEAVGMRALNNVVDITNYVMLELGNPLHAFDLKKVGGPAILIRRARAGEKIVTLDGVERALAGEMLVIADLEKPIAIAGVMGGANSEVSGDTAAMVLESANFHPINVRRTSAALGCRTEAVMRFEKSLDPELPPVAARRFLQLARELIPGSRQVSPLYDEDHHQKRPVSLVLGRDFLNRRLGLELPAERAEGILTSLSFGLTETDGGWNVDVPTFRATKDIGIPEDLVEEVGRIYGYDNIPPVAPNVTILPPTTPPTRVLEDELRDILSLELGFSEIYGYSFTRQDMAETLGLALTGHLELRNPLSSEETSLRRSLVPGVLQAVAKNVNNFSEFSLYEIGRVYFPEVPGLDDGAAGHLPLENRRLCGSVYSGGRDVAGDEMFFRVKGVIEGLAARARLDKPELTRLEAGNMAPWIHPAHHAEWRQDNHCLGTLGEIHPAAGRALGLRGAVGLFDLDLDALLTARREKLAYTPLPRYPGVSFDLSVVVPLRTEVRTVEAVVAGANPKLIREVSLTDTYRGAQLDEGMKSLTFTILCRSDKSTLDPGQAAKLHETILRAVKNAGWSVRG